MLLMLSEWEPDQLVNWTPKILSNPIKDQMNQYELVLSLALPSLIGHQLGGGVSGFYF